MAVDPYQAAQSGNLSGLRAFAADGGELDARRPGQLDRTPLHVAIEAGQADAARLLIELGADIQAPDYRSARPLHYAAGMGLLAVVELLLERGAEPGALNCFGETALHALAAGGGRAPEDEQVRIACRLVAAGVPADPVGNAGRTPLWYAAARGKAGVVAALLEAGADPARRAGGELGSPADVASGAVAALLSGGSASYPRTAAECEMLRPLTDDGEQDPEAMEAMRRETVERLRAANGQRPAIIAAIERFLDFGDAGEYSPAVLWDYFCISSPTVPSLAGYDAVEEDRITRIFSTCTHARYGGGQPLPPDWPWFEKND